MAVVRHKQRKHLPLLHFLHLHRPSFELNDDTTSIEVSVWHVSVTTSIDCMKLSTVWPKRGCTRVHELVEKVVNVADANVGNLEVGLCGGSRGGGERIGDGFVSSRRASPKLVLLWTVAGVDGYCWVEHVQPICFVPGSCQFQSSGVYTTHNTAAMAPTLSLSLSLFVVDNGTKKERVGYICCRFS